MRRRAIILILLLGCAGMASLGCVTIASLATRDFGEPLVYSGTRTDFRILTTPPHPHNPVGGWPTMTVVIIDLPFSLVLDTLLLPVTGSWAVYERFFSSYNIIHYTRRTDVAMVKRALAQPLVNVHIADKDGRTALHHAVSTGSDELLGTLIAAGLRIDETDRWGDTPLIESASLCDCDAAKLLLDARADPNRANKEGHTALSRAKKRSGEHAAREREYAARLQSIKQGSGEYLKSQVRKYRTQREQCDAFIRLLDERGARD